MKFNDPEYIISLTPNWKGERFSDGRPKVEDSVIERLKKIKTEEAWFPLFEAGYKYQFEGEFRTAGSTQKLIGRAVTAVMVPSRPDVHMTMLNYGRGQEGRNGYFNQWVIETMTEGDVLVVDMCDKIINGTYVGGNLSTAIKSRTKTGGAVIWGGIRDLEQIVEIEDYQVYYRGLDPSPIGDVMMTGMNIPCRIGKAICLPGDIVLGTISGVLFIPAHMAETIAQVGEKQQVKDIFGFERLEANVYQTSQIDALIWSKEVMDDFQEWFAVSPKAKAYQHLDWSSEIEKSEKIGTWDFTGLA